MGIFGTRVTSIFCNIGCGCRGSSGQKAELGGVGEGRKGPGAERGGPATGSGAERGSGRRLSSGARGGRKLETMVSRRGDGAETGSRRLSGAPVSLKRADRVSERSRLRKFANLPRDTWLEPHSGAGSMTLAMASVRPCTSWLIVNDHSFDYNFRGFFVRIFTK